jgi:hypothetical protein
MVMSRTEWNSLMQRLPEEDRTSYEDYLGTQEQNNNDSNANTSSSSFTEYWEQSAEFWEDLGDQYAEQAAKLENAANQTLQEFNNNTVNTRYTAEIRIKDNSCPSGIRLALVTYEDGVEVSRQLGACVLSDGSPEVPPVPPNPVPPTSGGGGGGGGGGSSNRPQRPPVKTAPIDTILFDEDEMPIEVMFDLIFENIGGQELINIARFDTINGQPVVYQPIKNLTQIQQQYNPNNILALQSTSNEYFQNFPIRFEDKVPLIGNGPNGSSVYIDPLTGDLIIETINIEDDEQVEVEITTSGTIYEAEL